MALDNRMRARKGQAQLRYDPFLDLDYFAETLLAQKKLGIFTIGGGVPRNWAHSSALTVNCVSAAPEKTSHSSATITACASALSPSTGEAFPALLILRPSPGANCPTR